MSKSYGQFCAIARALDHVGDRWTLLILRQLLINGPLGFGDIESSLPGVSPNLLVDRLRHLEQDGLVQRNDARTRSKAVRYALTDRGRSIEPLLLELIRFGAPWMFDGPGSDHVDPSWAVLALRALLTDDSRGSRTGHLHLEIADLELTVTIGPRGRSVELGAPDTALARSSASFASLLSVVSGLADLEQSDIKVSGDRGFAHAALSPRRSPSDASGS